VRKLAILVAMLVVAAEAGAATVVLTGGKRLDVSSYTVGGSYVTVRLPNGRLESYPLSVVDLQATRDASGAKAAPAAETPSGPHSPFFDAKSSAGKGGVVVTDADVQHIEAAPEGEKAEDEKPDDASQEPGSQVTLVSYTNKKVADGQWDITATVANQGKASVSGVTALMRVLDQQGKPVATGSGSLAGKLDPGKQANITARVALEGEPFQVAIDLRWQEIHPAPAATPRPVPGAANGQAGTPQAAVSAPPGWSVAAGAPPTAMPSNVMSLPAPNVVGTPMQVSRGEPKG
jgi:hypothetical protein